LRTTPKGFTIVDIPGWGRQIKMVNVDHANLLLRRADVNVVVYAVFHPSWEGYYYLKAKAVDHQTIIEACSVYSANYAVHHYEQCRKNGVPEVLFR